MSQFGRSTVRYNGAAHILIERSECSACGWRVFGTAQGIHIAEQAHICMAQCKRPPASVKPAQSSQIFRPAEPGR